MQIKQNLSSLSFAEKIQNENHMIKPCLLLFNLKKPLDPSVKFLADQAQLLWVINPMVAKLRILCACGQSTAAAIVLSFFGIFFYSWQNMKIANFLLGASKIQTLH